MDRTSARPILQVSKVSDTSCFRYSIHGFLIVSVSILAVRYCRYLLEMQSFRYLLTINIPICLEMALHASKNVQHLMDLAGIEVTWYRYRVSKTSNLCASVSISFLLLVSAEHQMECPNLGSLYEVSVYYVRAHHSGHVLILLLPIRFLLMGVEQGTASR